MEDKPSKKERACSLSSERGSRFRLSLGPRAAASLSLSLSLSFSSPPLASDEALSLQLSRPHPPPTLPNKNTKKNISSARLPRRRARRRDRPLCGHQRRRLRPPRVQPGDQARDLAALPQRAAVRGRPDARRHHRAREEQAVEGPRADPVGELRLELGDGGRRLGDDQQVQRGLPR